MNHRSRKLLDLAHELHECTNCGRYSVEGLEPAHQNGIEAGKGGGIKSHDHRHAALCHPCHAWYDTGNFDRDPSGLYAANRREKGEMWVRAHLRTYDEYWSQGWLAVGAGKA